MVRSRQLSRQDWIAAARELFIASGVDDVKVDLLAKKMRVTRGSFYWHFEDRKDLLEALLYDWEVRNHLEMAQIRTRWARFEPDLGEIVAIWLGEDPNFPSYGMAIRSWARKSAIVADAVHRIDDAWVALIVELFRRENYSEDESFVRARIVYFHQVGYYALGISENIEDRIRLAPFYYKALTGKEPSDTFRKMLKTISREQAAQPTSRKRRANYNVDESSS